ncbi:TORTIFOLIA1-like protein 2 isoform X2 [Ziziphus jujuba]|uniref:TORTIFOLIA1-like protein 2 isoform X2 n=1 Tax=Ziziphus jujuba TaxID=326968 RepID=A0ABM4A101_ZIZJJ|nr:TORTIFOLIA1-like protein 2 isoform X2 [Ziziphus jujuba]
MKANAHVKSRGPVRINAQQVVFELKHKVVIALNKLADRDTYQVGVDELEKTAECLSPDGIAPFLSCILDTDSEQKSAVRKECIRLMGSLVRYHEGLMGPHLGKMIASIVKRLKDPDSVVRDACVETVGALASRLSNGGGEDDGVFVGLVRPLFEALGEQNKQVQSGSALCLARVIDNTRDPPVSILQRMLIRTTKLLKNPHFMAKPAVIELNRSIIQARGAPTRNVLSAAMASIQESLKNSDWSTRKAASVALGEIASSGGSFLGSFKPSCIRSLESCRFDKVKPVRDTVLQALRCWRTLPGPDTPEPSEAGSSIKENFCGGDYGDLTSATESGRKDVTLKKVGNNSTKGRIPLSTRKACQNYAENPQLSKEDDWNVEIAVPKTHNVSLAEFNNEESEGSSITKTLERVSTDIASLQDIGYEYVHMDDKQECSSVSNLVTDNYETKFVTVSHDGLKEGVLSKPMEGDQQFLPEEIGSGEQMYLRKMRDRRSLDSTVTESVSQTSHGCCSQIANEMVCIRKQLLLIENKQSNLMDLLQVFTTGIMDSLSMMQSRVAGLENVVDRVTQDLLQREEYSSVATSKFIKQNQSLHSPRISTCTPRPSVDIRSRQPSLLSAKRTDIWEENTFDRSIANNSTKRDKDMWTSTKAKTARNPMGPIPKSSRLGTQKMGYSQIRSDPLFGSASSTNARQSGLESKNGLWKRLKGFLCEGDLDSAYMEALCSGDEIALVELLDRTGPVLEYLSSKTVNDLLSALISYLVEQRFVNSILPWLQQVVELSNSHGANYPVVSAKARQNLLSGIEEAMNMELCNPVERRCVTQIAVKLHNVWGGKDNPLSLSTH